MTAACAFGNSLTLPLAFLAALVPVGPAFDRAAGYTALCALAWAPLMWAFGHQLLSRAVFTASRAPGVPCLHQRLHVLHRVLLATYVDKSQAAVVARCVFCSRWQSCVSSLRASRQWLTGISVD